MTVDCHSCDRLLLWSITDSCDRLKNIVVNFRTVAWPQHEHFVQCRPNFFWYIKIFYEYRLFENHSVFLSRSLISSLNLDQLFSYLFKKIFRYSSLDKDTLFFKSKTLFLLKRLVPLHLYLFWYNRS